MLSSWSFITIYPSSPNSLSNSSLLIIVLTYDIFASSSALLSFKYTDSSEFNSIFSSTSLLSTYILVAFEYSLDSPV